MALIKEYIFRNEEIEQLVSTAINHLLALELPAIDHESGNVKISGDNLLSMWD